MTQLDQVVQLLMKEPNIKAQEAMRKLKIHESTFWKAKKRWREAKEKNSAPANLVKRSLFSREVPINKANLEKDEVTPRHNGWVRLAVLPQIIQQARGLIETFGGKEQLKEFIDTV